MSEQHYGGERMVSDYSDVLAYISSYWKQLIRHSPQESGADTLLSLPHPYLIPSNRIMFQEMYYWDSFFTALGLVGTQQEHLIVGLVENMAYLYQRYGLIPNASRGHFLSRSQPPVFTKMIWLAFGVKRRRGDTDALQFLAKMMRLAELEHDTVWLGEAQPHYRLHNKEDGLSRYFDTNFLHDLAACESGWDHSPRCQGRWLDHLPVDLNAILYLREMDFAEADERHLGRPWRASLWRQRAKARADMMNQLMWDDEQGFYFDVDFKSAVWKRAYGDDKADVELPKDDGGVVKYRRSRIPTLAGFFPLWAKLATREQAARMVKDWLPRFELAGGLVTTLAEDVDGRPLPAVTDLGERYQWMYPNGWAPLQWVVVKGLDNYDYFTEANAIRRKWCETCAIVFRRSDALWEKYNVAEVGGPPAGGLYDGEGNVHPFGSVPGFGWSNGVFVDFEQRLRPSDTL